jgi:mannan polymerase II complex MNN11 subunit
MLKDVPIVPPDSIIKTFTHLQEKDVDLIITQDKEDLNPGSFILRNGEFARFFLDIWFDPLYRNYNFAKAEVHGLVCFSSISLLSPREIQLWGCWDVG